MERTNMVRPMNQEVAPENAIQAMMTAPHDPIRGYSENEPNECVSEIRDTFSEEEPAPPKCEFRNFSVKGLNYGYIIQVGCHNFAVETKERLVEVLSNYITDPTTKEEEWWSKKTI